VKRLVPLLVLLGGCSATPYAEIGMGWKFAEDQLLAPEYVGGRNPTAHFEIGLAWASGYECGISHWSHYRDGGPFNDRPETYKNEVECRRRWVFGE
jgi:hypothetical protein